MSEHMKIDERLKFSLEACMALQKLQIVSIKNENIGKICISWHSEAIKNFMFLRKCMLQHWSELNDNIIKNLIFFSHFMLDSRLIMRINILISWKFTFFHSLAGLIKGWTWAWARRRDRYEMSWVKERAKKWIN